MTAADIIINFLHRFKKKEREKEKKLDCVLGGPYTLEHLSPLTKYTFRFATMNEVGSSSWGGLIDAETPRVSEPSEPVLSSRTSDSEKYIKSSFANRIELRWTIPSSNGPDIDEYNVKICEVSVHNLYKNIGKIVSEYAIHFR